MTLPIISSRFLEFCKKFYILTKIRMKVYQKFRKKKDWVKNFNKDWVHTSHEQRVPFFKYLAIFHTDISKVLQYPTRSPTAEYANCFLEL